MWEIAKSTSHKQGFMRRTISFVIATLLAIIFVFLFNTQPALAADASWQDMNSITYNDNSYKGPLPGSANEALGLDVSSKTYSYVEPITDDGSQVTVQDRKIHIIYFEPDADLATAINAKYKTYTYISATEFTNPSPETTITIDTTQATTSPQTSSCDVENGVGWLICPITNFLANAMDFAYRTLSDFLFVRPASSDQNGALYRAWSYMRNIANIAFLIAFLIVIYSQLTNVGVSNYGLKRLLPRLIIASILVNLSYYICAIAIDISNILGYSLQDVFLWIRDGLVGPGGGNSWNTTNWSSITGFILSGGTAAIAGATGLVLTLSTYGVAGSLFLLLPALMSGLMAVIVALVVIAGRQALITILAIISPLAFVAYLLPNTEKLFEKWKSLFLTLLVVFPAFSVIFGGAQLAGTAIIQNANSINAIILGMLIQVFPLFITPMLIKLSGSTLAGLANIVNNPNRGLIDRTRKFTEDRAENIKARRLAMRNPNRGQFLVRNAQRRDHNRRRREYNRDTNNATADARWYESRDYRDIDQRMRHATERKAVGELTSENRYLRSNEHRGLHTQAYNLNVDKQFTEQTLERDLQNTIRNTPAMLDREMSLRIRVDENSEAKARVDDVYKYLKANVDTDGNLGHLTQQASDVARDISILAVRSKTAERLEAGILHEALMNSPGGVNYAAIAGEHDDFGESRVRATAVAADAKTLSENASAAGILLDNDNLDDAGWLSVARGVLPGPGGGRANIEQQIAAVQHIIQVGYEPNIAQLIEDASARLSNVQQGMVGLHQDEARDIEKLQKALGAALAPSSKKPQYFPGPKLGELSRGAMTDSVRDLIISTLTEEDLSMESFGNMSLKEMERINGVLTDPVNPMVLAASSREALARKISETLNSDIARNKLTSRQVEQLEAMVINLTGHP